MGKDLIRLGNGGTQLLIGEGKRPVVFSKPGWVMLVIDTSDSMNVFPRALNRHMDTLNPSGLVSTVVDGRHNSHHNLRLLLLRKLMR